MLLLLFQTPQNKTSTASLTQHTIPIVPDPFNKNHNSLFSTQLLQTTNGPLSLSFIFQPISMVLIQLHFILKKFLPFMACSIEYNMSSSYVNSILLGQDLGVVYPTFAIENFVLLPNKTDQEALQSELSLIDFFSSTNQPHNVQFTSTSKKSTSPNGQLTLTKSIEQLLLNNIALILKFVSLSFTSYQQAHPSPDGQLLFDINSTRIQWILQLLVQVSSLSAVTRVKANRSYNTINLYTVDNDQESGSDGDGDDIPSLEHSESNTSMSVSVSMLTDISADTDASSISASDRDESVLRTDIDTDDDGGESASAKPTPPALKQQPPPPPQQKQLGVNDIAQGAFTLDLECSYLLNYLLSLTNATVSSFLSAQFTTVGMSNPYIVNLITLLSAGSPVTPVSDQINTLLVNKDDVLSLLKLNYSASALLPVTFNQVKKILHPDVSVDVFTNNSIGGIYISALMNIDEVNIQELYDEKYSSIITLLQQSQSTITKSSTSNKSQSQSQVTSSTHYIMVGDFVVNSLQAILESSVKNTNTLTTWSKLMTMYTKSQALQVKDDNILANQSLSWNNQFLSLFSPSIFASILPQQLTLITTGGDGTSTRGSSNQSLTSLPLTSISSLTTPTLSLFLLAFDAIVTVYTSGLAHLIAPQPTLIPCYLSVGFKLDKTVANNDGLNPYPILPARTTDLLHFTISYFFSLAVTMTQFTHQQTLTTTITKQINTAQQAPMTILIPNYTSTILSLLSASISKVVSTYTLNNGLLSYFILSALSIPTLSSLATLSTANVHLQTLVTLVLTSSANRQVSALSTEGFPKVDRNYDVYYQNISKSELFPLEYSIPNELCIEQCNVLDTANPTTASTQTVSQLIINPKDTRDKYNTQLINSTTVKLGEITPSIEDISQFVGPKWIHTLLQFFHNQIVPADLRLCDEQLLEQDIDEHPSPYPNPNPTPEPENDVKGEKSDPTALDMLIKYNIISPYLDCLFGTTSSLSIIPDHSQHEKDYANNVHIKTRKDVKLQHQRVQKLQILIQHLSMLSFIAKTAPNLALFILKYTSGGQLPPKPTPAPKKSGPIITVEDDELITDVAEENGSKFVPTYPLLATLLYFATSLSTDFDSADIEQMAKAQAKADEGNFATEGEKNEVNEQYVSYHNYQLLMTKNLTIEILSQLTQDITIKSLIVAHGIDLYSLLMTPDEYLIQYGPDQLNLAPKQSFPEETFPKALIPRSALSETSTKQILHTNLLLALPQLTPTITYQPPIPLMRTAENKGNPAMNRFDAFSSMWGPKDLPIVPNVVKNDKKIPLSAQAPLVRTTYTSRFAVNAVYSVGLLVASQNIMINKHDSELLLETSTQLLAHCWHQLEYLSYLDHQLLLNIDQWYIRHHNALVLSAPNSSTASKSKAIVFTPATQSKLKERKFPNTMFAQSIIGLVINSVAELFRLLMESLMYLCVDFKVKQASVKYKLFYLLHAFCGCISAHNAVPSPTAWKTYCAELAQNGQQQPDVKPHHVTVQIKNTNPTQIDLFNLVHSQVVSATANQQTIPTAPTVGDLHVNTVKIINTYLGEYLLKDTSIRLGVLQILHHFALSKDDIKKDEEQSQTSEQVAALKAAASRGVKTAARGQKGTDGKDISELYGTAQEMMPLQLLTTPYIIDCLFQVKCAYQYAFVCGLPANVRALIESSLAKSIPSGTAVTNMIPLTLSAKYSNNLLLPIPVMMMMMQILKTYSSLKLPNDVMSKRYKSQLVWSYNVCALILDITSQSNVLQKEMQRRDAELIKTGPVQPEAANKTIYPQRYYYPRKDYASTTQSDTDLSNNGTTAAPALTTEQVGNTIKLLSLWCSLSLSRLTMHINPHTIKEDQYHRIFPILVECALSDETTHELTIYECLLAVTNLLACRQEQEYTYCTTNKIVDRCLNQLLLGGTNNQFNIDITTATVEFFCNLCGMGVLDHFLNEEITNLDILKETRRDQATNQTIINNQGVLLLRVLMQYSTYDDVTEKNVYKKTSNGIVESSSVSSTSLMRLKCAALGCLAMLAGSSPYLAACISLTTISAETGETETKDISAPVALLALFQAPVQSPEHEQGVPDPSTGVVLGFKDIRVRCKAALQYIQQVVPMLQQGKELNKESW
jgi:hypothetical protein